MSTAVKPFAYASNITAADAARRILAAQRTLITTHSKPDGDAIGSVLALARVLSAMGRNADILIMGPLERQLKSVIGPTPFIMHEKNMPLGDYELVVVLDTGSPAQLEPIMPWLRTKHDANLGIDHHAGGQDVAAHRIVETRAAATTQVLLPVLDAMGATITGGLNSVAEALYLGLATDTGWFKYANTDAATFRMAARMLDAGVNSPRLFEIIEEGFTAPRLALEARALASIEYCRSGAVAVQTIRMEDFAVTGATPDDLTGLVNDPMVVGSVRVSILFAQSTRGITKVSFRSKPPRPDAPPSSADDLVDVNALAHKVGGGGHVHAAGARLNMDLDQARTVILGLLD